MSERNVNRKKAPRREVVSIEREGAWGRVEYLHLLDCGHTEKRKRASQSKFLSCAWCVIAEQTDSEMKSLLTANKGLSNFQADDDLVDEFGSSLAVTERMIGQLRAEVSAKYEVPVDAVDVVISDEGGQPELSYAIIFIPATELSHLLRNLTSNPLPADTGEL